MCFGCELKMCCCPSYSNILVNKVMSWSRNSILHTGCWFHKHSVDSPLSSPCCQTSVSVFFSSVGSSCFLAPCLSYSSCVSYSGVCASTRWTDCLLQELLSFLGWKHLLEATLWLPWLPLLESSIFLGNVKWKRTCGAVKNRYSFVSSRSASVAVKGKEEALWVWTLSSPRVRRKKTKERAGVWCDL